jgi:hypothetical protein
MAIKPATAHRASSRVTDSNTINQVTEASSSSSSISLSNQATDSINQVAATEARNRNLIKVDSTVANHKAATVLRVAPIRLRVKASIKATLRRPREVRHHTSNLTADIATVVIQVRTQLTGQEVHRARMGSSSSSQAATAVMTTKAKASIRRTKAGSNTSISNKAAMASSNRAMVVEGMVRADSMDLRRRIRSGGKSAMNDKR